MTALRDRDSDPADDEVAVPWDTRPVVGDRRGVPWWGAVLLAFGLAILGAVVDMRLGNAIGWAFNICYFLGTVGAICAVQRRNLFGPMVQPPLVLAITVPGVVLLVSGLPSGSDTMTKAFAVGRPLINGFPVMAIATCSTLVIGLFRLYRERNPYAPAKGRKPTESERPRRPPRPAGPGEDSRSRPGQPRRDDSLRGRRPPEPRGDGQRYPSGQNPLPPPGRRRPADDGPWRGDPGVRGGNTPPPPFRGRARGGQPEEDRRRAGGPPGADRPRRMPPRSGDPRGPQGGDPRRAPGRRGAPPPRRRPWEDDA